MKLTTAEYKIKPEHFRKSLFSTYARSYFPMFIVMLVVSLIAEYVSYRSYFGLAAIVSVLTFVLMPLSMADTYLTPKYLLKNYQRAFDISRTFEFDEEGMMINCDSGSYSYTTWIDTNYACYSHEMVQIGPTRGVVMVIPDSVWPSTVERDRFLALLRSKSLLK